jgi:hypothetical protein
MRMRILIGEAYSRTTLTAMSYIIEDDCYAVGSGEFLAA